MTSMLAKFATAFLLSACVLYPETVRESEIIDTFNANRNSYEELVVLLYDGVPVRSVDRRRGLFEFSPESIEKRRKDRIVQLMNSLELDRLGVAPEGLGKSVSFPVHESGLGVSGTSIAILFSDTSPRSQRVESIDEALRSSNGGRVWVHRHIAGSWYLEANAS